MESESSQEDKITLENELAKGMELAKQLSASVSGNPEGLIERIVASYEEALLILNKDVSEGQGQLLISSSSDTAGSSISVCKAQSEDSSRASSRRHTNKRQERGSLFTTQKRVNPLEEFKDLDDGYSWRKYGQKDILGSKYPRSYYRCEHQLRRNCYARKQVQRSDDDPCVFEITYRGKHTCVAPAPVASSLASPGKLV